MKFKTFLLFILLCANHFSFSADEPIKVLQFEDLYIPEMVTIPAGCFQMGDILGGGGSDEKPVHRVCLKSFEIGKFEITFAQWDKCVAQGGCSHKPDDQGWGRGNRPVINVSYNDISQQFIPWLNKKTGLNYRLPTEAEWEYAARAGSKTKYSWGNSINCSLAQYDGGSSSSCYYKPGGNYRGTAKVGSFKANKWGLHDMHGNIWEWVQDCWNGSYRGAPSDGTAWKTGACSRAVLRGGSWFYEARYIRSANRNWYYRDGRDDNDGFRLSRTH